MMAAPDRDPSPPGTGPRDRIRGPSDPAELAVDDARPDDEDLPLDAHLHTLLSPDSNAEIDAHAAGAMARGIAEIAITDHVDFDPGAPAYAFADFPTRERYVREAAERWAGRGVAIRFGVELTYRRRHEEAIREHLARYAYDYAIGSVHIAAEDPWTPGRVAAWVEGKPIGEIVRPYFDEILGAIESELFDTIGHLDYVKKYLAPHVPTTRLAEAPELYEPLLRALVDTGTSLEVNTSGLRQAPRETYPAPWAVARYRELGGRRVTVGSDAHVSHSFAFGLGRGYGIAGAAGFDVVTFRSGGTRSRGGVPVTIANPRG
jgi:histidinol-phosphatase (PHP family)